MTASERKAPAAVAVAIIGGSLAGVMLRWVLGYIVSSSTGQSVPMPLGLSSLGGVALGIVFGVTLSSRSTADQRLPLTVALVATIATFGAAAVLDAPPNVAASGIVWRDTVLNVGAAILAAGAGAIFGRRWRRS